MNEKENAINKTEKTRRKEDDDDDEEENEGNERCEWMVMYI